MIAIHAILLALAISGKLAQAAPSLEEVCADKRDDNSGFWMKVSEAQELLRQYKESPHRCDSKFSQSLEELSKVLEPRLVDNFCIEEMDEVMRDFKRDFVSINATDEEEQKRRQAAGFLPLPKVFRDFFLVLEDSVSFNCRLRRGRARESENA